MTEGVCNKLAKAIEEKVIYQNPLLFLKVWDIVMETSYCDQLRVPLGIIMKRLSF